MHSLAGTLLFVIMPFSSSSFGEIYVKEKRETAPNQIKACGSALADTVASVCMGVYKGKKRGDLSPRFNDILDPDYFYNQDIFADTDSSYPFRSKRSVSSALRPFRTKREVRIVDECCKKSCHVDEIIGYCG